VAGASSRFHNLNLLAGPIPWTSLDGAMEHAALRQSPSHAHDWQVLPRLRARRHGCIVLFAAVCVLAVLWSIMTLPTLITTVTVHRLAREPGYVRDRGVVSSVRQRVSRVGPHAYHDWLIDVRSDSGVTYTVPAHEAEADAVEPGAAMTVVHVNAPLEAVSLNGISPWIMTAETYDRITSQSSAQAVAFSVGPLAVAMIAIVWLVRRVRWLSQELGRVQGLATPSNTTRPSAVR
jgi:hypothetical protein